MTLFVWQHALPTRAAMDKFNYRPTFSSPLVMLHVPCGMHGLDTQVGLAFVR
jgi:hypothetical protein